MFTLTFNPLLRDFAVRPVCKSLDRNLIREIFRKEFYGSVYQSYPDDGLWKIYDSMETNDEEVFGAYLVSCPDRPLLLLEIHPAMQMDLLPAGITEQGTVGIYCFYASSNDPLNLPAFRTCISSLLDYPGIDQVITAADHMGYEDPKVGILLHSGFTRLAGKPIHPAVYRCTRQSFPHQPACRLKYAQTY